MNNIIAISGQLLRLSGLLVASTLAVLSPFNRAIAESPGVRIFANYSPHAAYVQTIGTLYSGAVERNSGSGLLIGDSLVITNSHVIPPETNFKNLEIIVRLGSRQSAPLSVSSIRRDAARDLAVLHLKQSIPLPRAPSCPLRLMDKGQTVPTGSSIYVLGYPVEQDISISDGIISNKTGPNGRWQTSVLLNPGNSGGPAFGESGLLVGFAVSGIVRWRHGDEVIPVQGVNFLIPTDSLLDSPLLQDLDALPMPARCWALASMKTIAWEDAAAFSTLTNAPLTCTLSPLGVPTCSQNTRKPEPREFARSYTVMRTKDDHPNPLEKSYRSYQEKFTAEPGYRITQCRWHSSSENHVDSIACHIDSTGTSVRFDYRLFSGPAFDRYRGWLFTTVTIRQARE